MAAPNGNLSLEEREVLTPGAEVVWQSERMDNERPGRVARVNGHGAVIVLDTGANILSGDFVRLAEFRSAVGQRQAAKPSEPAHTVKTAAQPPEPAKAQRRGSPAWNKGLPKTDYARWIAAVQSVRGKMDLRQSREAAVRNTVQDYPDLHLTAASFAWWQRRFLREGKIERRAKTMPKRAAYRANVPAGECPECADRINRLASVEARYDEVAEHLDTARARIAEMEHLLAERDAKIAGMLAGMPARGAGAVRERLHMARLVLQAIAGEEVTP